VTGRNVNPQNPKNEETREKKANLQWIPKRDDAESSSGGRFSWKIIGLEGQRKK